MKGLIIISLEQYFVLPTSLANFNLFNDTRINKKIAYLEQK